MITAREAIDNAYKFLKEEVTWGDEYKKKATLEEIEYDRESKPACWNITLSFPNTEISLINTLAPKREYKVFKVNSVTGEVFAMKIRE